jgi:hypothetical protein
VRRVNDRLPFVHEGSLGVLGNDAGQARGCKVKECPPVVDLDGDLDRVAEDFESGRSRRIDQTPSIVGTQVRREATMMRGFRLVTTGYSAARHRRSAGIGKVSVDEVLRALGMSRSQARAYSTVAADRGPLDWEPQTTPGAR